VTATWDTRIPWTVQRRRRKRDCSTGHAQKLEAWRSFFALKEKGENANPRRTGATRRTDANPHLHPKRPVHDSVGQAVASRNPCRARVKRRIQTRLPRTTPPRSPRQPEVGMANRAVWNLSIRSVSDTFRAFQPVTVPDSRLDSPLAFHEAALDVGANNLVACSTTTGNQYLYDGRELFGRFRETTDEIARLQSKLREGRYSSKRIRRLYRQRTKRRDPHRTRWCATSLNRCTMRAWRHRIRGRPDRRAGHALVGQGEREDAQLLGVQGVHPPSRVRLRGVHGISLEAEPKAWTSQTCPECGDHETTVRHRDTLTCPVDSRGTPTSRRQRRSFENSNCEIRPMARPVQFEKGDDHDGQGKPYPHESPKEVRTNPQVASVGR